MLMVQVGFPLLDGIASLLLTMLEAAKGYFSNLVAQYNTRIKDTIMPEPTMRTIGFKYDEGEEPEDEEVL